MSDEPTREDADFDRDFWRAHARRGLQEAFRALEVGRIAFGNWERLFLSAAIDHFRERHFEQSARSAQRILTAGQISQPFSGRFSQERSLADHRAEYEELALGERG